MKGLSLLREHGEVLAARPTVRKGKDPNTMPGCLTWQEKEDLAYALTWIRKLEKWRRWYDFTRLSARGRKPDA